MTVRYRGVGVRRWGCEEGGSESVRVEGVRRWGCEKEERWVWVRREGGGEEGRGEVIYLCITACPMRALMGVKVPGVRGDVGTLVDWIPGGEGTQIPSKGSRGLNNMWVDKIGCTLIKQVFHLSASPCPLPPHLPCFERLTHKKPYLLKLPTLLTHKWSCIPPHTQHSITINRLKFVQNNSRI